MTRSKIIAALLLFGMVAIVAAAWVHRAALARIVETPDAVAAFIERSGAVAPVALVAAQTAQVVVFIIPGDVVQIASGYLFGVVVGSVLSVLGILIGSSFNYAVGRVLGRPFVERVAPSRLVDRIDRLGAEPSVRTAFFTLFVIPGLPKDVLCYLAGATAAGGRGIGYGTFIGFSIVGRIPGIVGSALIGANVAAGRPAIAAALLAVAVGLLVLGIRYQAALERVLSRITARIESLRARRHDR